MAGFKTHITFSAVTGAAYGAAGLYYDVDPATCVLAGGMCAVSGMLPDLDSDNGIPLREIMGFSAAVAPMLLLDRFRDWGLSREQIVLAGAGVYLFVRFIVAEFIKRYTVHRGMWHSIPAAATAGLLALWVCQAPTFQLRFYKGFAVLLGFLSHLLLDEFYSIDFTAGRLRFKKSFGTALKMIGPSIWGNLSTYGKLALVIALVYHDPIIREQYGASNISEAPQVAEPAKSAQEFDGPSLFAPRMAERIEDQEAHKPQPAEDGPPLLWTPAR